MGLLRHCVEQQSPMEQPMAWNYRYADMINLSYPGLRVAYSSPKFGAPIFEIDDFLTEQECDQLTNKVRHNGTDYAQQSGCVSKGGATTRRTSTSFLVPKSQTEVIHQKIQRLTNRHEPERMEHVKLIHYEPGNEFTVHADAKNYKVSKARGFPNEWWDNFEITIFMYLNDVTSGGEAGSTHFHTLRHVNGNFKALNEQIDRGNWQESLVHSIKPRKGKAVLFFPCVNKFPDGYDNFLRANENKRSGCCWVIDDHCVANEDMLHRSVPTIDPKDIATVWIWPRGSIVDRTDPGAGNTVLETDGIIVGSNSGYLRPAK